MQEEKTKNKKRIAERLCKSLDISPDILSSSHKLEVFGRSAISISGCKKILLYAPCEIRLALKDSMLCIVGRDLVCVAYSPTDVTIEGRIDDICFKEI